MGRKIRIRGRRKIGRPLRKNVAECLMCGRGAVLPRVGGTDQWLKTRIPCPSAFMKSAQLQQAGNESDSSTKVKTNPSKGDRILRFLPDNTVNKPFGSDLEV